MWVRCQLSLQIRENIRMAGVKMMITMTVMKYYKAPICDIKLQLGALYRNKLDNDVRSQQ